MGGRALNAHLLRSVSTSVHQSDVPKWTVCAQHTAQYQRAFLRYI